MRFGPADQAPNPLQRWLAHRPLAATIAAISFTVCVPGAIGFAKLSSNDAGFGAYLALAAGLTLAIIGGTIWAWRHPRRENRSPDVQVLYLPWPWQRVADETHTSARPSLSQSQAVAWRRAGSVALAVATAGVVVGVAQGSAISIGVAAGIAALGIWLIAAARR